MRYTVNIHLRTTTPLHMWWLDITSDRFSCLHMDSDVTVFFPDIHKIVELRDKLTAFIDEETARIAEVCQASVNALIGEDQDD